MARKATDVMTRDVITVQDEMTLKEVAEVLLARGISGAPVVNPQGQLVGIISESDILNEEKREAAIPRSALWGAYLIPEETLKRVYENGLALRARDVMTTRLIIADEDTPVEDLIDMMVLNRINRIPIVRDGKPVGIVTREDILRALVRSPEADTHSAHKR